MNSYNKSDSMYFEKQLCDKIPRSIRELMKNEHSRLWGDYVTEAIVRGKTGIPAAEDFLRAMQKMG